MTINVQDFEKVVAALFVQLKEQSGETIEIKDEDYYWAINQDEKYNPYQQPSELTIGQLSEDWDSMSEILNKQRSPISYDFVKISSLMQIIGYKTVW